MKLLLDWVHQKLSTLPTLKNLNVLLRNILIIGNIQSKLNNLFNSSLISNLCEQSKQDIISHIRPCELMLWWICRKFL